MSGNLNEGKPRGALGTSAGGTLGTEPTIRETTAATVRVTWQITPANLLEIYRVLHTESRCESRYESRTES